MRASARLFTPTSLAQRLAYVIRPWEGPRDYEDARFALHADMRRSLARSLAFTRVRGEARRASETARARKRAASPKAIYIARTRTHVDTHEMGVRDVKQGAKAETKVDQTEGAWYIRACTERTTSPRAMRGIIAYVTFVSLAAHTRGRALDASPQKRLPHARLPSVEKSKGKLYTRRCIIRIGEALLERGPTFAL